MMPTFSRKRACARRLAGSILLALACGAPARAEPPAQGCPPPPAAPSEAELKAWQAAPHDRGFLWRIVKDDHTSWLYGTIHVARREWALPGPLVARALRAVDTLALELDPLDPAVKAGLAEGFAAMRRPVLSDALNERIARVAADDCLPDNALATLPPPARVMVLTTLVGRRDGLDPAYGIDALLAGFGHARALEVVSLETPARQLALFDMGSDAATAAWIDGTLGGIERGVARAQLTALATAWANGNLDGITVCSEGSACLDAADDQAMKRRVLDDRNPDLAAAIDALHTGGKSVFAAVGSLHMTGPLGLPALLAARGYQVERIAFASP